MRGSVEGEKRGGKWRSAGEETGDGKGGEGWGGGGEEEEGEGEVVEGGMAILLGRGLVFHGGWWEEAAGKEKERGPAGQQRSGCWEGSDENSCLKVELKHAVGGEKVSGKIMGKVYRLSKKQPYSHFVKIRRGRPIKTSVVCRQMKF